MDRTTYTKLIAESRERLMDRRNAATALHELAKNLSPEEIRSMVKLAAEAFSDAETAEFLSEKSGIPVEKIAELRGKVNLCRV